MRGHFSARLVRRSVLVVGVIGVALGASSLASATGSSTSAQKADNVKKVFIRGNQRPHFVGADVVHTGQKLKIVNETDPRKIGPHTFSLVKPTVLPRTKSEQRKCFNHGHICRKIARWHGFPPATTRNPVRVGHKGWDKAGDLHGKGDSFFTGHDGSHFKQVVSADGGVVFHFMCAIHPFMHKRIEVKP